MLTALLMLVLGLQQLGASRTVLATVADARGRAIVDIEADDFVVRETGRPRDVLSVRVADYPIAVVLDNGPGAGQDFVAIREAAARFIGRIGHRPIAVALSDPARLIATFDDDRPEVLQALETSDVKCVRRRPLSGHRRGRPRHFRERLALLRHRRRVGQSARQRAERAADARSRERRDDPRHRRRRKSGQPGDRRRRCARSPTRRMDNSRRSIRRRRIKSRSIAWRIGSRRS